MAGLAKRKTTNHDTHHRHGGVGNRDPIMNTGAGLTPCPFFRLLARFFFRQGLRLAFFLFSPCMGVFSPCARCYALGALRNCHHGAKIATFWRVSRSGCPLICPRPFPRVFWAFFRLALSADLAPPFRAPLIPSPHRRPTDNTHRRPRHATPTTEAHEALARGRCASARTRTYAKILLAKL